MVKDMGKAERKGVMVMGVLVWLVAFLFWLGIYRASAEEPPFFRAEPQYPSVFMIFDNSDSMQDVPYLDVNGLAVRPSGRMWKENVKLNSDGRVIDWQYVTWPDVLPDLDENANPDRKADGGNHPASKLYQAKLALNVILNHIKDVNLGFATYMTQRDPKVTAKYYTVVPEVPPTVTDPPIQWKILERKTTFTSWSKTITSPYRDSFVWNRRTITGGVGTKFKVPISWIDGSVPAALSGQSCSLRDEEVELTVTSVVPQYRDGALLYYSWTFGGSYKPYKIYSYEDKNDKVDPSVPADGVWHYSYSPYHPPQTRAMGGTY